ncbi:MAG: Xaa-Pro peptidase family protein [Coriobacteriia bacterium]
MNADHALAALRRRMVDGGVDAFLVTDIANMRYVTGFEDVFDQGANAACVVTGTSARLHTDFRYAEAAVDAARGTAWDVAVQVESLYIELCAATREDGVETLALESSVPYGRFKFVSEQFCGNVVATDQWIEEIRQVKTPEEIERISAAAAIADHALGSVLPTLRPGMLATDVAVALETAMRQAGADGVAFESIVAGGPDSARPHARPGRRPLERGDLVVLDLGARYGGYCSDMTRTVVIGPATVRQRELYDAVLEANEAALSALRPGLPGSAVDAVARDLLRARGLGDAFGHGLGHGVGLEVHELPSLSARARESVREGSVVTIEPGVYLPGIGGVRIEDLVVVEEGGCRLLSHAPKGLLEV